ncbi:MAG TPA: hypothetical protein VLT45_22255 [Kofleriaceae bacterium]|nr:hypothetical protein [Kofleriaceae bacterium]
MSRLVRGIPLVVLVACTPKATQYTLKVNLADQSATELCAREVDDDSGSGSDAPCKPFAAQALTTPATLTVKLQHPSPQLQYDLRVSQFTREANPSDAQAILTTVIQRASALAALAGAKDGNTFVVNAATKVADAAPKIASTAVDALATKPSAVPPTPPATVFDKYLDTSAKKLHTAAEMRKGVLTLENEPVPSAPPRAYVFDDADLAYLAQYGVTPDQAADFVIEWCTADSFQKAADAELYKALADKPNPEAVSGVLALSAKDVASILLAKGDMAVVKDRIEKLLDEAKTWTTASAGAKSFAAMRLGKTLTNELQHCQQNIAFLESKVSDAERSKLDALAKNTDVAALTANALKQSAAFDSVFGPLFQKALVETEKTVQLANADASTTITLEPGRLEMGVGQTDSAGKRTEIASYKVDVRGVERLAILIGPTLSYCSWHCFEHVDSLVSQPGDTGGPGRTVLTLSDPKHDFSLATALHITVLRFSYKDHDFGLGGVFGYPLGSPKTTSSNFLVGLGLRHGSGFELSAGVHAFSSRVLKAGYKTPIDLTLDGNQGLTADSVSEDTPEVAFFVMIGFAPDVFSSLKE